jgi:hypothetical protein
VQHVRAFLTLRFYAELPDSDSDADDAFDAIGDEIALALNRQHFAYVVAESFTIEDGDTEPDE